MSNMVLTMGIEIVEMKEANRISCNETKKKTK
jgi:hypothetical protein